MSNCNQVGKDDNFSRSSPKKLSHYSRGEMKKEIAEDCNDNDQDVSCQNIEHEKPNVMSHENENYTLVSLIPPSWKKMSCGEASKIKTESSSEKRDVNEEDILKLDVQDEVSLENEEADEDLEFSDDMADVCKTICHLCHKIFTLTNMRSHTLTSHKVQITDYKQMYGNFEIIKVVYHKCHLCGKNVLLDNDRLGGHIKGVHKMKEREYKANFMTLVTQKNGKGIKEDGNEYKKSPQNGLAKTDIKEKLKKVNRNSSSKVSKGSKERPLPPVQKQKKYPDISDETSSAPDSIPKKRQKSNLIQKQKQNHDLSIEKTSDPDYIPTKQRKTKYSSKKTKIEANRVKKVIIDVDKDEDESIDDISSADNIVENRQKTAEDITINCAIVKDLQDNSKHVAAKDNTEIIEDVPKNTSSDNVVNGIVENRNVGKDFIGKIQVVDKDDAWISDSENNNLYRNGGPVVESGWKFCFEARTMDGFTVMIAKYMSPDGNVYVRGEDGYQIPDLMC